MSAATWRQQAHDDEFGGADAEGTGGERKDGGRHAGLQWMARATQIAALQQKH
ncbi:hypothetical protein ACVJDU_000879 [Bradyrhizobium diazoefficiens]